MDGELGAHDLEHLAVGLALARCLAGLAGLQVLAGLAHERAQLLRVGGRVRFDPAAQRVVVGDEAVAPLLGLVQQGGVLRRAAGLLVQGDARGVERGGVELAHQLADVLDLPAPSLEVRDAPGLGQGVDQAVGQFQPREQVAAQGHERLAQRLQVGAFALEVGLADLDAALELALELLVEFAAFGHEMAADEVAFFGFAGHVGKWNGPPVLHWRASLSLSPT